MSDTSNKKLPTWIKLAKEVLEENSDAIECLSTEELFYFVNNKLPIVVQLSYDYFRKILNEDYTDKYFTPDVEFDAKRLRDLWKQFKINAQLNLYKTMKQNEKCFQRELSILERRFRDNWKREQAIDLKADQNIKQNVSITFKQV